jgi:hypothetical protein
MIFPVLIVSVELWSPISTGGRDSWAEWIAIGNHRDVGEIASGIDVGLQIRSSFQKISRVPGSRRGSHVLERKITPSLPSLIDMIMPLSRSLNVVKVTERKCSQSRNGGQE